MFTSQLSRLKFRSPQFTAMVLACVFIVGNTSLLMASVSGWVNLPATGEMMLEKCRAFTTGDATQWHVTQTADETGEIVLSHVVSNGWLRKTVHFGYMQPGENVVTINGGSESYRVPFTKVTSLLAKVDPATISRWTFDDWELWFQINDIQRESKSQGGKLRR